MNALDALPLWVRLSPLAWAAGAFACAAASGWFSLRIAGLGAACEPGLHWTERARRASTVRSTLNETAGAVAAISGVLAYQNVGPASLFGPGAIGLACCVAAIAGHQLAVRPGLRRLMPERPPLGVGPLLAQTLLVRPLVLLLLVVPFATGSALDLRTAVTGASTVLAIAVCVPGGQLRLARLLGVPLDPSAKLRAALERATAGAAVHPRFVAELRLGVFNALALPLGGALVVSRELVDLLDEDELAAVCGHELGHLAEPRSMSLFRAAVNTTLLGACVLAPPLLLTRRWAALAGLGAVFLAVVLLFRPRARVAEVHADETAHRGPHASGVYARALEKIYRANLVPAVMAGRRQAHPHLYDRLLADGVTPNWPRPAPPSKGRARAILAGVSVLAFVAGYGLREGARALAQGSSQLALVLGGRDGSDLAQAAYDAWDRGDRDGAVLLYRAAAAAAPGRVSYRASLAAALAGLGRCDDAGAALREAHSLPLRREDWESLSSASRAVADCRADPVPAPAFH
ncbi:MAG: M48 family metalloprotease [Myxococcales bacterium]